jgi:hypothetical protein
MMLFINPGTDWQATPIAAGPENSNERGPGLKSHAFSVANPKLCQKPGHLGSTG